MTLFFQAVMYIEVSLNKTLNPGDVQKAQATEVSQGDAWLVPSLVKLGRVASGGNLA